MFVWNRYEVSRKFCLWARELPFDFVVFHINRDLDDFFSDRRILRFVFNKENTTDDLT